MDRSSLSQQPTKKLFQKKSKNQKLKRKVEKFGDALYGVYGEMMSKLSHE